MDLKKSSALRREAVLESYLQLGLREDRLRKVVAALERHLRTSPLRLS